MRRLVLGVVVGFGCHGNRGSQHGEAAAVPQAWHYTARVDAGAEHVDVELCFTGQPSPFLAPGLRDATALVHDVREALTGEALTRVRSGSFRMDAVGPGDCVRYRVDLSRLDTRRDRRIGDSVITRQGMWLWHPDVIPDGIEATLTLELAKGVRASVPWRLVDGTRGASGSTYAFDETVYRWLGYTAFGDLELIRFEAGEAEIEVARLDGDMACSRDGLQAWATDAIDASVALFGHYPRDHLQMLVIPVSGGWGSIYYGMAGRGGGAGVYILMDDGAEDAELIGGWTTTHELLHHGMPFVDDPWMGEGWVTYYTEVLRTRTGHRSEAEGWRKLWKGFGRGARRSRDVSLGRASKNMGRLNSYQMVYWGGAALAFVLDVELRLSTDGETGLDDAVREIRRCCGDAKRKLTAQELLEHLDRWHGAPVFTRIAKENLKRDFPDVEAALSRLGVTVDGDDVILDDDHPAAQHRRAIMLGSERG